MRGIDDGNAAAVEFGHALKNKAARLRVDADGDFVEKHHPRPVDQPDGEIEPPLQPAGKVARLLGGVRGQPAAFDQAAEIGAVFAAVKRGEKRQVVAHAQQRIEGKVLRHQRDLVARFAVETGKGGAVESDFALPAFLQAGEQRHQRGFASTVGAEQAERRAFGDVQRDIAQGVAVGLRIAVAERAHPYHAAAFASSRHRASSASAMARSSAASLA